MWATKEYRLWSHRLASPVFRPVMKTIVHLVSENRLGLSRMMKMYSERELAEMWKREEAICGTECGLGQEVAR